MIQSKLQKFLPSKPLVQSPMEKDSSMLDEVDDKWTHVERNIVESGDKKFAGSEETKDLAEALEKKIDHLLTKRVLTFQKEKFDSPLEKAIFMFFKATGGYEILEEELNLISIYARMNFPEMVGDEIDDLTIAKCVYVSTRIIVDKKLMSKESRKRHMEYLQRIGDAIRNIPNYEFHSDLQDFDEFMMKPSVSIRRLKRNPSAGSLVKESTVGMFTQKICVVGKTGSGKTSIVRNITGETFQNNPSTDVLDTVHFRKKLGDDVVEFSLFDFGGEDMYTYTHPLFLQGESIFILAMNSRVYNNDDYISWKKKIESIAPGSKIFVAITHQDSYEKPNKTLSLLENENAFLVSNKTKYGFPEFESALYSYVGSIMDTNILPPSYFQIADYLQTREEDYIFISELECLELEKDQLMSGLDQLNRNGKLIWLNNVDVVDKIIFLDLNYLINFIKEIYTTVLHRDVNSEIIQYSTLSELWMDYPLFLHVPFRKILFTIGLAFPRIIAGEPITSCIFPALIIKEKPVLETGKLLVARSVQLPKNVSDIVYTTILSNFASYINEIWTNGVYLKFESSDIVIERKENTILVQAFGPVSLGHCCLVTSKIIELLRSEFLIGEYQLHSLCCGCIDDSNLFPKKFTQKEIKSMLLNGVTDVLCHECEKNLCVAELCWEIGPILIAINSPELINFDNAKKIDLQSKLGASINYPYHQRVTEEDLSLFKNQPLKMADFTYIEKLSNKSKDSVSFRAICAMKELSDPSRLYRVSIIFNHTKESYLTSIQLSGHMFNQANIITIFEDRIDISLISDWEPALDNNGAHSLFIVYDFFDVEKDNGSKNSRFLKQIESIENPVLNLYITSNRFEKENRNRNKFSAIIDPSIESNSAVVETEPVINTKRDGESIPEWIKRKYKEILEKSFTTFDYSSLQELEFLNTKYEQYKKKNRSGSVESKAPITADSNIDDVRKWLVSNGFGDYASKLLYGGQIILRMTKDQIQNRVQDDYIADLIYSDLHASQHN